jgi:dCTP deaminase
MDGSILTGPAIEQAIQDRAIVISDYDPKRLNPNSYNLTLANTLSTYPCAKPEYRMDGDNDIAKEYDECLDVKEDYWCQEFKIHETLGEVLIPGVLYLGSTAEHTETYYPYVPMLEGRSSLARLGLSIHVTAGFGDVGYKGKWTLEMSVVHPLKIYPGDRVQNARGI